MQHVSKVLPSAFGWFDAWRLSDSEVPSTGLRALDRVIGGLAPGTLTVIEGDAQGRLAAGLLLDMALSQPAWRKVAYFSLDLSTEHTLVQTILRSTGGVNELEEGVERAERAWHDIIKAAGALSAEGRSLWLNDRYDLSAKDIEGECWKVMEGSSNAPPRCMAFVDSIHGVRSAKDASAGTRLLATTEHLAAAAERLHIPVVVTAHSEASALEDAESIDVLIRVTSEELGEGPWPTWPTEYGLEVVRNDGGPRSAFVGRVDKAR